MKLDRRRQALFVYEGFGFPVMLRNVPMVYVRGCWTPDVDYNELSMFLLNALAQKPTRLTGSEIRFIRISLSMTLQQFAARFAVSHPAVIKWEAAVAKATNMVWATEKDIRLELLRRGAVKPAEFVEAYGKLSASRPDEPQQPTSLVFGAMLASSPGRHRIHDRAARVA